MAKDKKVLYTVAISLFIVLLSALFIPYSSSRYIAAILLLLAVGATLLFIKKRSALSYNKRQALGLMAVIALVYLMLFYLTGLYFGFKRTYMSFGSSFIRLILPITVIIITVEIIRSIMLMQNNKVVSVIFYLTCIIADIAMLYGLYNVETYSRFMDIVGHTVLPSVTANALYHYVAKKYGSLPNIVYRLIITLYAYILPVEPGVPEVLSALIKLIMPMIVYAFIFGLFEKKRSFARAKKKTVASYIALVLIIILMISIVMLISCQFRYGALVIATESMTGELNKGDVAVYEQYNGQIIKTGQVIVYNRDGTKVVHRVAKIENVNGVNRYYTKGDIYDDYDVGYRTDSDIIGLAKIGIPFVGFPTIWLRSMF